MKKIYFGSGLILISIADILDKSKCKGLKFEKESKGLLTDEQFNIILPKIFRAEKYILREPFKNQIHLSIPFNRKVKYIYGLDTFYYQDYENYNFNKLSDLFLNIHIFIN